MTELTIDQAFQQAVEAHKAGRVQEADRFYTAILKAQPRHSDANHNMGVLAVGIGKVQEALPFFKTALEINPAKAQFWLSYIDALIKLGKLADGKAVLDQAKSKGAKGDGFDKLEQRLNEAGQKQETLTDSSIASEPQPKMPNILDTLKLDQAIKLAKKKNKEGYPEEAKRIYQDILAKLPKNKRASDGLKGLTGKAVGKASKGQEPPQTQTQALINLYSQGQFQQALKQAEALVQQFPKASILFNIHGAVLQGLGQLELSVDAYKKAIALKPDYGEAYNNMGIALKEQGKLEGAIEAYNKALAIKPDYANAYYNMGNALKDLGKLEEAIEAYNKALAIEPNHAEAYNNIGSALKKQGKLKEGRQAIIRAAEIIIPKLNDITGTNVSQVLQLGFNLVLRTEEETCIKRFSSRKSFRKEFEFLTQFSNQDFVPRVTAVDHKENFFITPFYQKLDISSGKDFSQELMLALKKMEELGISHNDISIFNELFVDDGTLKIIDWENYSQGDERKNKVRVYYDRCAYHAYSFMRNANLGNYEPAFVVSSTPLEVTLGQITNFVVASYAISETEYYRRIRSSDAMLSQASPNKKKYVSLIFKKFGSKAFAEHSIIEGVSEVKKAIDQQVLFANDYMLRLWRFWWQKRFSTDETNPVFQYRRAGIKYRYDLISDALQGLENNCLILDIGSNAGEVSEFITSLGFSVIGFEPDPEVWNISVKKNIKNCLLFNSEFETQKINGRPAEAALLLSVFHRIWALKGPQAAIQELLKVSENVQLIIFEGSSHLQRYGKVLPQFESNNLEQCNSWHMELFKKVLPQWKCQFIDHVLHTSTEPLRPFYILKKDSNGDAPDLSLPL